MKKKDIKSFLAGVPTKSCRSEDKTLSHQTLTSSADAPGYIAILDYTAKMLKECEV